MKYHISINSFYANLVRNRYKGNGYGRYMVDYYSKSSGDLIASERDVKIKDSIKEMWEKWEG